MSNRPLPVAVLFLLAFACRYADSGGTSGMVLNEGSFYSSRDGAEREIGWNDAGVVTHVYLTGDVEFTPDDTDVAALVPVRTSPARMRVVRENTELELFERSGAERSSALAATTEFPWSGAPRPTI